MLPEIHHVDDSGCEDTVSSPPLDISNDIQQRIGLLLLKLENVHNVPDKCTDVLVEELHFIHDVEEPRITLILYIDDFEICNLLGTSRKKHKITAVYWVLANIPAGLHSTLCAINGHFLQGS